MAQDGRIAETDTVGGRFLQHVQTPQNQRSLVNANGNATGVGSCGDSVIVQLQIERNTITDIECITHGCAFTVACASAMSTLVKGRSIENALDLQPDDIKSELGGLPDDHMHCARLAVNTLGEAIAEYYKKHFRNYISQSNNPRTYEPDKD